MRHQRRFQTVLLSLVSGLAIPTLCLAGHGPAPASESPSMLAGISMLALLFAGFYAMTRYDAPLPLVMSLVACAYLALQGPDASNVLADGFRHFSGIVILFTAVAVPAHLVEKSRGFDWLAGWLGYHYGVLRLRLPRLATPLLIALLLGLTCVTAGLMHNVTSILIMTPIIVRLCDTYRIPSRWILCGALVASNLGGFSTRWGDTPNIIEAECWKLTASDFLFEIVPANALVLAGLIVVVQVLTQRSLSRSGVVSRPMSTEFGRTFEAAKTAADWKQKLRDLTIDRRLLVLGVTGLAAFILMHVTFDAWKIAIGASTIAAVILALDGAKARSEALKCLGFEVYLTFAAIFVLAGCLERSWVGEILQCLIRQTDGAPWMIAVTSYLGTMFTEAASWATAVSVKIQQDYPSHAVAWALGGGICAGSSSLVTAASAGVILAEESRRFGPEHEITFRRYLPFGVCVSLLMLAFYGLYFTFNS